MAASFPNRFLDLIFFSTARSFMLSSVFAMCNDFDRTGKDIIPEGVVTMIVGVDEVK